MNITISQVTHDGVTLNAHSPVECSYDMNSRILRVNTASWLTEKDAQAGAQPAFRGAVEVWVDSWNAQYACNLSGFVSADPAGVADYTTHYTLVSDLAMPVPVLIAFPMRPSKYHAWDWLSKTWGLPDTALAAARADQCSTIDAAFNHDNAADITYMNATFQADQKSQMLLVSVITASAGTLPAGFAWYDINNTAVPMNFSQLQGLAAAILARGQTLFTRKQVLKAAIRATTITELVKMRRP